MADFLKAIEDGLRGDERWLPYEKVLSRANAAIAAYAKRHAHIVDHLLWKLVIGEGSREVELVLGNNTSPPRRVALLVDEGEVSVGGEVRRVRVSAPRASPPPFCLVTDQSRRFVTAEEFEEWLASETGARAKELYTYRRGVPYATAVSRWVGDVEAAADATRAADRAIGPHHPQHDEACQCSRCEYGVDAIKGLADR